NLLVADPTLKVGLTNKTDLELGLAPFNFNQSHVRGTNSKNTAAGFGDVYARLKYNLLGNDGGNYAVAITPYVKAPTAAHNVGND
ncbi:transporter, partial [Klebsiella pneumoniae]|uniref:transporter n=1 Tax=Klebsiella pneumoniae TaxID=573 RepID=UPI003EE32B1B